jgi:hypothetical protein
MAVWRRKDPQAPALNGSKKTQTPAQNGARKPKIVRFSHWAKGLKIGYTEKEWLFSRSLHNPAHSLKIEQKPDFRGQKIDFSGQKTDFPTHEIRAFLYIVCATFHAMS